MKRIQWDNGLSVGVGLLDAQHMNLAKLINELGDALDRDEGRSVLAEVIKQLRLYASYHFSSEERLLRSYSYPQYDAHRREHQDFIEQVEDFALDLRSGVKGVSADLHEFLFQWFGSHIQQEDMRYAAFLKERGVS
ncbi:MAG: bacteriohemerythrin [Desulfovibrionaceae bacterium]